MAINVPNKADGTYCCEAFSILEEILENENIKTVFQPIISLETSGIFGYEALSRGPEEMESPEVLFSIAKELNKLWELEYLCRRKALESTKRLDLHGCIFLNVSPDIINNPNLRAGMTVEALSRYDINPENIIIEITEKNAVQDYEDYEKTIDHYKQQGYHIAIDDAGSGYSGLKLITDVRPHFVKLDRAITHNVDKDKYKLHLIKSFKDFCGATGIKLIAEGIETQEELETLIEIGVSYGQGYYIQRPSSRPAAISDAVVQTILEMREKKEIIFHHRPSSLQVSHITRKMDPVVPEAPCSAVAKLFSDYPFLDTIPIVQEGMVWGIVTRDKFYAKLGSQYGYAIFYNRSVSKMMVNNPLTVDLQMPIDAVSKMAMDRVPGDIYDSIVVISEGRYYGIVTVKDLLDNYTEMEIYYARNQNPLTGLPGNNTIEGNLYECVNTGRGFAVIYVDIDNFKPYNDVYGFASGDRVIRFLANILVERVYAFCDQAFVGHVGGDDFVVIVMDTGKERLESLCRDILEKYREGIEAFYCPEHIRDGGITTANRNGGEETFGISTVSIACVTFSPECRHSIYELSQRATRLKKKCKELRGNIYCIE